MKTKNLVTNAVIGAIYAALALALAPISFGALQFRVSEALTLVPFLNPATAWGVTIGCLISNLFNPLGVNMLDVIFGTLATLIAALLTSKCKNVWLAALPPVIINMLIIGPVLAFSFAPDAFLSSSIIFGLEVGLGQVCACFGLGIPLAMLLKRTGIFSKKA